MLTRATKAVPITERESHRQIKKIVWTQIRGYVLTVIGGGGEIGWGLTRSYREEMIILQGGTSELEDDGLVILQVIILLSL